MREAVEAVAVLLSLFAPYTAEDMWSRLGHEPCVALAGWPAVDRTATAVIGAMILGVGLMQLSQPLRHGYRVVRNLCAPLNHRYARFSNWLLERPPAR